MMFWIESHLLWVKAFHVIFAFFWIAGLFMLPRYLIYHQEELDIYEDSEIWEIRERRIVSFILNPALIFTWLFGSLLVYLENIYSARWFIVKLLCVILLTIYHFTLCNYAKNLAVGKISWSSKSLRLINEIPAILLIFIIICVIVKPF
jgi:protoporphyrinogen IX oxidase